MESKKIKYAFSLFVFTIICLSFIGCADEGNSNLIDLQLSLTSKAKTNTSRDICPSNDELTVFKFIVNGIGPNDKTFNLETIEQTTLLTDLVKGKWDISVTGYNKNDEAIVEGSGTYYLFNSQSKVNISLDYINGEGQINIDLYWNVDQVDSSKVGVITTYYKLENNNFSEYEIADTITYENGHAIVSTPLPSGSYIIASKLFSGTTELAGFAEQLRVLANHTTLGSNTFIIGDTTLDYGITFTCNTHLPIQGVITSTPTTIIENQEMTLTFSPTTIPDGYTEDQINYQWYYEGAPIEGETTNTLTILPVKGEHRYDLFSYIDGISGTLGSTKIIITCN